MGSFLVRQFLIDYPGKVDGAIIAGTGQTPPIAIKLAEIVANQEAKKSGDPVGDFGKGTKKAYNHFHKAEYHVI